MSNMRGTKITLGGKEEGSFGVHFLSLLTLFPVIIMSGVMGMRNIKNDSY